MIKQRKNRLRPVCLLGSVWTWSHWAVSICGSAVSVCQDGEAAAVPSSKSVNGWSEGMNCFHQTAVDRKTKCIITNCWHICLKGIFNNNVSTIEIDDQVIDQTNPVHYNCVLLCIIHHLVLF